MGYSLGDVLGISDGLVVGFIVGDDVFDASILSMSRSANASSVSQLSRSGSVSSSGSAIIVSTSSGSALTCRSIGDADAAVKDILQRTRNFTSIVQGFAYLSMSNVEIAMGRSVRRPRGGGRRRSSRGSAANLI